MVIYSGWHSLVWAFKESQQRVLLPIFTAFPINRLGKVIPSPNLAGAKVLLFRDYSQTKSEINFNEFCNSLKNMVLLNDYLRKMK